MPKLKERLIDAHDGGRKDALAVRSRGPFLTPPGLAGLVTVKTAHFLTQAGRQGRVGRRSGRRDYVLCASSRASNLGGNTCAHPPDPRTRSSLASNTRGE